MSMKQSRTAETIATMAMLGAMAGLPGIGGGPTFGGEYIQSKPNGTRLARSKHKRRVSNESKRRNRGARHRGIR